MKEKCEHKIRIERRKEEEKRRKRREEAFKERARQAKIDFCKKLPLVLCAVGAVIVGFGALIECDVRPNDQSKIIKISKNGNVRVEIFDKRWVLKDHHAFGWFVDDPFKEKNNYHYFVTDDKEMRQTNCRERDWLRKTLSLMAIEAAVLEAVEEENED